MFKTCDKNKGGQAYLCNVRHVHIVRCGGGGAVQLCEVVKLGAMSLGSAAPEPQVLLLHAARDVAAALRDLCGATTAAAGKHVAHPDMHRLKHAAKVHDTLYTDAEHLAPFSVNGQLPFTCSRVLIFSRALTCKPTIYNSYSFV